MKLTVLVAEMCPSQLGLRSGREGYADQFRK
jgi:hypothetical protein